MLQHLGVRALLDLGLRLGEGSGAALAWPLLQSACAHPARDGQLRVGRGVGEIGNRYRCGLVYVFTQFMRHYLLALQFFTRIPVTGRLADWVGYSPAMLRASAGHFPGVGWLVGGLVALYHCGSVAAAGRRLCAAGGGGAGARRRACC
jgi:hypothetical protein